MVDISIGRVTCSIHCIGDNKFPGYKGSNGKPGEVTPDGVIPDIREYGSE